MDGSIDNYKSAKVQAIIRTAEELFQRYGVRRVSTEEICRKASVSKMTFYKYFPNKEELFKLMLNRWFDESMEKFDEVKAMESPFMDKVRMILRLKEEFLSKLSNEFLEDYMNPEPELQAFMQEFYSKGMVLFIEFIKDAQKKGEVRPEMRPEFLIAVLNKMIELAKDTELMKLYPNVMDLSLEINNFFYCGIMPLVKPENTSVKSM